MSFFVCSSHHNHRVSSDFCLVWLRDKRHDICCLECIEMETVPWVSIIVDSSPNHSRQDCTKLRPVYYVIWIELCIWRSISIDTHDTELASKGDVSLELFALM